MTICQYFRVVGDSRACRTDPGFRPPPVVPGVDVTLLGSGEALGTPAPLCGCEYCAASDRRRRPALLVEGERGTVVLDAGPDLTEQLAAVGQPAVDAFLVTHHHFDHAAGLKELDHAATPLEEHVLNDEEFPPDDRPPEPAFEAYLTATAQVHLSYRARGVYERLEPGLLEHGVPVAAGGLSVVPFPVDPARPAFDTVGFAASDGESAVVYAPDTWTFPSDEPAGGEYRNADLLVAGGGRRCWAWRGTAPARTSPPPWRTPTPTGRSS